MNRRDNETKHHTSIADSARVIQNYIDIGAPPEKLNLGFAYYAKYFTTAADCGSQALGCPVVDLEDATGKDTYKSGAWTFEKTHLEPIDPSKIVVSQDGTCGPEKMFKCSSGCCGQYGYCGTSPEHCGGGCQYNFGTGCTGADVYGSWQRAAKSGSYDEEAGAQYFYDAKENLFWTWDTPEVVALKFDKIVKGMGLGGVMAWSLGEDSYDWSHIKAMAAGVSQYGGGKAPTTEGEENVDYVYSLPVSENFLAPYADSTNIVADDVPVAGAAKSSKEEGAGSSSVSSSWDEKKLVEDVGGFYLGGSKMVDTEDLAVETEDVDGDDEESWWEDWRKN
jgi:chitinase